MDSAVIYDVRMSFEDAMRNLELAIARSGR